MAKEILFQKHKNNIQAATLLMQEENAFYASGVHCLYYSSYQLTEYVLVDLLKMSEENLQRAKEAHQASGSRRRGSHELVIMVLFDKLREIGDDLQAVSFKNQMFKLKALRVQADYKNVVIETRHSTEAIELSTQIITDLYTKFNLI